MRLTTYVCSRRRLLFQDNRAIHHGLRYQAEVVAAPSIAMNGRKLSTIPLNK